MKVFHCDQFTYPLPAGHRFPAAKYSLLRERVAAELTPPCELFVPDAATDEATAPRPHPEYLAKVCQRYADRPRSAADRPAVVA